MARYNRLLSKPMSEGAYRPSGKAPPAPWKLWQAEQLVRNSSPPRARSSSLRFSGLYSVSVGIAGPGQRLATYAASDAISSSLYRLGLTGACSPGRDIGIRPVDTWKSTAAAPTPISDGP